MRICIVFSVFLLGAFAAPKINKQLDQQWNLFKQNYDKHYASLEEEVNR